MFNPAIKRVIIEMSYINPVKLFRQSQEKHKEALKKTLFCMTVLKIKNVPSQMTKFQVRK